MTYSVLRKKVAYTSLFICSDFFGCL